MKQITLNKVQEEKLRSSLHAESATHSQLQLAQQHYRISAQQRQDILELIYSSNGIDAKSIPAGVKITIKDSTLYVHDSEIEKPVLSIKTRLPKKTKRK